MSESLDIEVAYADQGRPTVRAYALPAGSTVGDALRALQPDWNAGDWLEGRREVGVFGRVVGMDFMLCAGDRVELYEPLPNDPKAARRQRARSAAKRNRAPP